MKYSRGMIDVHPRREWIRERTLKSCTFRERSSVYRGQKHLPSLKATPLSIRCAISLSRNSNDETCVCVCVCFARANDVSFRRVAVVRCERPLSIYGRRSLFTASNSLHSWEIKRSFIALGSQLQVEINFYRWGQRKLGNPSGL